MGRGKRVLAAFLVAVTGMSVGITAAATDAEELTPAEQAELEEQERMYELPVQTNELPNWPQGPGTYSEAAIVMEAGTGAIIYGKNIDEHHYPASITKILTALVALENGELSDAVTFSADSLSFLEPGDAFIGMKEGNVISLEQALYAILLASANEVSYATGESVGINAGHDYNWFIQKMNETCQSLGGMNSNFVNTNGLHDDNHYTCARDMALIGSALLEYPQALLTMQTTEYKIEASETTEEHVFQQNHKMFYPQNSSYYEYAIGGKTGYTDQAHTTLVTMADNGVMRLVCVTLKSRGSKVYPDTRALFDYGFGNFKKVEVEGQEKSEDIEEILKTEEDGYVIIPETVSFEDLDMELTPDEDTDDEAVLTYTYEGNTVGKARARLSDSYMKVNSTKTGNQTDNKGKKEGRSKTEKRILVAAVVLLVILIVAFVTLLMKRIRIKRNKKRKKT